jgi:DNA-binding XRE family transcriptional regulator
MGVALGKMIQEYRLKGRLTQDQLGHRYGVSGPAIFKFEKGMVNPTIRLWLKMAADMDLGEGPAILCWVQAKLPEECREHVQLRGRKGGGKKGMDLSQVMDRDKLRETALADPSLPAGLKSLVRDDEVWLIYKPTGHEINLLREWSQAAGDGRKSQWREALRVLRAFTGSEA